MNILGITFGFHESAACLVQDGKVVFACAEERLSRKKQDTAFPALAIRAALDYGGLEASDIDHLAFGWPRPWQTSVHNLRLMLTGQMPPSPTRWERLFLSFAKNQRHRGGELDYRRAFGKHQHKVHFVHHHLAHALSAYCLSGFDDAAVLIVDGRGAREATSLWRATPASIALQEQYEFPNSLGLFYARMTEMLGFQPYADEWKVMGLAAYGQPSVDLSPIIQSTQDHYWVAGRQLLGRTDTDLESLEKFLGPRRNGQSELDEVYQNIARSTQDACERAILALTRKAVQSSGSRKLCMAGGVALNCKANGEILRSGLVDDIYIQPAAGDDGACIGAALSIYPELGQPLPHHTLGHTYLGPEYSNREIEKVLEVYKLPYRRVDNPSRAAAELLAANRLIGWFQGRMEFGPRALGNRSILANPKYRENMNRVNEAVKFREGWRPFAPSVIEEAGPMYFDNFKPSPYMVLSFQANQLRVDDFPAVIHADGSCRVQSVTQKSNPLYYELISHFHTLTSLPIVMNTSFNLKGDPIVCAPKDAVQTFYTSGLDDLVIGTFVVSKRPESSSLLCRNQRSEAR